jgi:hypothetical protein
MMMLYVLVVSVTMMGFHFWLFQQWLLTLIFGALSGWMFSMAFTKIAKDQAIQHRDQTMYYFIQLLITTLAIKKTVLESYVDVYQRYQLSKQTWLMAYGSNDPLVVLDNLKQKFPHPIFGLFVSTLNFYETQGGDVLTLFEGVLSQTRLVETRRITILQIKKRMLIQFGILWALNLFVIAMAKLVLFDLFTIMMTSTLFVLLLTVVLLYLPLSLHVWLQRAMPRKGTS